MALSPGSRLGPYEITTQIGVGGMGEVYRARDGRLHRDVAIKVLPDVFAQDGDRLARFEREARSLASLNHQNIAAIYGLEDADGVKALVMELVEGPTLADVIARGPIPIADALPIARQMGDALEAAHEQGVIHRDIKPANIKVRDDGTVKVLDFGLAKAMEPIHDVSPSHSMSPTVTSPVMTRAGVILGTAAYMSPEQARGYAIDKRTDIWAFGCVLFEMLTGRRPFAGETVSDLIAAILEREPDWDALPDSLPSSVVTLLKRALDKNAKRRLRDIGDARIEIDDAIARPKQRGTPASASARVTWRRWIAPAAVAVAGLVALVVAGWRSSASLDGAWVNPFDNATFTRFTDFPGTETSAVISRDGRFVAFLSDQAGPFNLWLSQVGTGRFSNLTRDLPSLPFSPNVRQLGFSGDGADLTFVTEDIAAEGAPQIRKRVLMPFSGGISRPFLPPGSAAPSWSPDGTQLVYVDAVDGDPIFIADRTGSNAREIFKDQPGRHNHNVVWASDGEWIYFVHGLDTAEEMDVWRIPPSGGTPERVTRHGARVTFITPLDPRTLLYVAPAADRSGPWLWAFDVEAKRAHRVSGLGQYRTVSASSDGRRVVATVANPSARLWSVPIGDRVAVDADIEAFPTPTARALGPRFRGTSMFYLSARGPDDGLWRLQDGQATEVWKGSDGALRDPAAVSPDGSRVVIMVRKAGKGQLMLLTADGAESRTLAESIDVLGAADWAPDGTAIVTGGSNSRGPGLFKIPIVGGTPERLAKGMAINPVWSSDGSLIVYATTSVGGRQPLAAVRPDGTPVALPQILIPSGTPGYRFLPGGKGLVYLQAPAGRGGIGTFLDLWLLDPETKMTRHLAHLTGRQSTSFDLTPDGKRIVFEVVNDDSDIVLIDLPK
jgi:serine/threonine protein kinase/dipeptidyl aminopeptidase/acylaminoacyl peptidase